MFKKKFQSTFIKIVDNLVFSERVYLIKLYAVIREVINYLLCLPNLLLRTNKNNIVDFIIYSQGRTGSTLLVD